MKAILALGLLAAVCFVGAGCGSGKKKAVTLSFTAPTSTTLANVKTGETIRCGSFGAEVPSPGQGVTANADGISSSGTLQLVWRNGVLHVTCKLTHLRAAVRPTAAGNKRAAAREAVRLLRLFVPPPQGTVLQREPSGDEGFLRRQTFFIGGQSVNRHSFWRVGASIDSVLGFVRAHPPKGPSRRSNEGAAHGYPASSIPPNRSLDFMIQRRPSRWIEVTLAGLRDGSTGIRVDAVAGWIVPRSPSEKVPPGVREIDIHSAQLSARVTQPGKVQTIIRWFDALGIVQGGAVYHCPALLGGSRVTLDFRSASRVLLARAVLVSGTISTECSPIGFSIHGHRQTPLVGLTFWNRVKRLVGLANR